MVERSFLLLMAGLVVGGGGARTTGTGAGRAAGGARMPELAPPGFPLPNGLEKKGADMMFSSSLTVHLGQQQDRNHAQQCNWHRRIS